MKSQVLPLSQETFNTYGDVIETRERGFLHINNGLVGRYHDLVLAEILEQDRTLISINRAQLANLSLTIHELGRHPLGIQAFIPMKGEVFVVVVTLGDDEPDLLILRAFTTNGEQGVSYHRNIWHHPLSVWQHAADLLTIGHSGSDNYDVESIPEQGLYLV